MLAKKRGADGARLRRHDFKVERPSEACREPLTPDHGAPVRLYTPIKLGYKMTINPNDVWEPSSAQRTPAGTLIEGTVDLAFRLGEEFTVIDFKTDLDMGRDVDPQAFLYTVRQMKVTITSMRNNLQELEKHLVEATQGEVQGHQ